MATHRQRAKTARYAGWATLVALAVAVVVVLLAPSRQALATPAERPAAPATYQVTLSVGSGVQYDVLQDASLALPINVSVTGAVGLAAATVLVQYDPLELRPVACDRQPGAPSGYCNIAWDTTTGLVRFNILSAEGVLGTDVGLFTLTFEPAPTATLRRITSITPLLESVADVQGNYMTSWMQGSTARVLPSTAVGAAVYVGGPSSPNPISITRGTTVTVPIVVTDVAGLGSASFSLTFNSAVVRPLECRPVQLANASGTCALHDDHVSANVLSDTGLTGTIPAFEVVFTTAPAAMPNNVSPLDLTLGAFADTAGAPITVRFFNNALKVTKTPGAVVPVLRMNPTAQFLLDDQRVDVQVILDNGTNDTALSAGTWGIRYDATVVQAEACLLYADGLCNATGEAGLVRMTVVSDTGGPPSNIGTITFRRHPLARRSQRSSLAFEVTNFANADGEQVPYQTLSANITIADSLGTGPAVAMHLVGSPPYNLPQGSSLDFPINFQIDFAQPILNLSGSIHYDPLVLRPTRCLRYDQGNGPLGYCNAGYDRQNGIIRFNLLSEAGITGSLTPFVFTMEAASTSKQGDKSALHFTVEAIAGPDGGPRTWAATDESVSVKVPVPAPRVIVGPPDVTTTAIYTVTMGSTQTVPIWVEAVPDLGAGTVAITYDTKVARATRCTLRSALTPALDGGFCSLLPGVVRFAFVASQGITGTTQLCDIEFAQAPNVTGGETTPLAVVVDNFVDTGEIPIPTSIRSGRLNVVCGLPAPVLSIARPVADVSLTWPHITMDLCQRAVQVTYYEVWRDAMPYTVTASTPIAQVAVPPGSPAGTVLSFTQAPLTPEAGLAVYRIVAVAPGGRRSGFSNTKGAFSYRLVPGSLVTR